MSGKPAAPNGQPLPLCLTCARPALSTGFCGRCALKRVDEALAARQRPVRTPPYQAHCQMCGWTHPVSEEAARSATRSIPCPQCGGWVMVEQPDEGLGAGLGDIVIHPRTTARPGQ